VTIANRTDIPTAITLDTGVKNIKPLLQFGEQIHLGPHSILTPNNPRARLSCQQSVWERLPTLMGLGQLRWTGKAHRDDPISVQPANGKELLKSAFVTTPDQNAESIIGVFEGETGEDFVQGIARIAGVLSITERKILKLVSTAEEVGTDVGSLLSQPQEALDFTLCK
jgi:hypothetical protein